LLTLTRLAKAAKDQTTSACLFRDRVSPRAGKGIWLGEVDGLRVKIKGCCCPPARVHPWQLPSMLHVQHISEDATDWILDVSQMQCILQV